jgi:putative DNA primase/helicase
MDLPDKLKAEWPGILNWVVQGCLLWRRDGLGVPATVVAANQAYRSDMDTLAPFLDDCCVLGLEQEVRSRDLYATYSVWCSQNGEKELSQRELTSRLLDRGDITKKRLGHGGDRGLNGVGLISERQSDPWASVLGASALADADTW